MAPEVEAAIVASDKSSSCRFAIQDPQRGTGDSARCALSQIPVDFHGDVLVTYGDMPSIASATLVSFVEAHRRSGAALSFITIKLADPAAYGRVIRDAAGRVQSIKEARDASSAELKIDEINTGVYLIEISLLRATITPVPCRTLSRPGSRPMPSARRRRSATSAAPPRMAPSVTNTTSACRAATLRAARACSGWARF